MKTTGKGSPAAREPIVNRTRSTSEITEDNTLKKQQGKDQRIVEILLCQE